MPVLDNEKFERFAQGLAKGQTQITAYRNAGYNGSASNASTLARDVTIKARVSEIRAEARGKIEGIEAARQVALADERQDEKVTLDWLKRELMRVMDAALAAAEFDAAIKCIELGARLIGVPLKDKDIGARAAQTPNGNSNAGSSGALAALNRLAERVGGPGGDEPAARDQPTGSAQPVPAGHHGSDGAAKPVGGGNRAARLGGGGIPSPTEVGSFE